MDPKNLILSVNNRLKSALFAVSLESVNGRLYLRATFPPKPDSLKDSPHQQKLNLRMPANLEAIKKAEIIAKKVGVLLACHEFNWQDWGYKPKPKPQMIGDWVEKFKTDYFNRRGDGPKVKTTWKTNYHQVFSRLPLDQPLKPDLLYGVIVELTEPNTRTRQKFCLAINALARTAQVDFDAGNLRGNYSPKKVSPRNLPEDKVILEWFYQIPNPSWRWLYGMMATYGLRDHEVFFIELSETGICEVLEGKTDERRVWPLYPEWVKEFDLINVKLPNCNGETHSDYTNRVCRAFRRYHIPFPPLTLRHCWAVRSLRFGWDKSLAAAQMGHSVLEHDRTYHHWISERVHQEAFDNLLVNDNRPLAPLYRQDL